MSEFALEIQATSKAFFGVHALRGVSFGLEKGHILGLIGQNGAGKSTLMNIIGGVVLPDVGTMLLNGQFYSPRNPSDANHAGIAFIHQELNLFTNLSVAENIFIDDFPKRGFGRFGIIDKKAMRQRTRDLLQQVDMNFSPETLVEQLSPGERQLVEIARALHIDANIIIFDEPTTSLTSRETQKLFEIISRLREAGKTMIYISHILSDIAFLADDIVVLRDGEVVGAGGKDQFDINRMISLMVGRDIEDLYPQRITMLSTEPVLQAKNLSEKGIVKDIDLTLYRGEVLGLFGLMGSGRTELARILFGLDSFGTGEIIIQGTVVHNTSARTSIRAGMAFVTENRREEGLLMSLPISENIALASLSRFAGIYPLQWIDELRLRSATNQIAGALQIKGGVLNQRLAESLSGGNQQKVVIAKWLISNPSVFIMDEPTRGIDVGAKYEIYSIINQLASQGGGILFISSELEELMAMCDRILVMSRGEIVGQYARANYDKEQILRTAFREGSNSNEN